ncbi:hypothetical protein SteCoe_9510 [Stentor coeruleus]|uniref:Protein kinase domain-containing protein n=1 Tax=Stentor coeruleus TaxID=5963 RepID=A0A1R2CHX4_9CILI|nr:hypothetical protein SteCoe_9510 [Stentor coeruleus]
MIVYNTFMASQESTLDNYTVLSSLGVQHLASMKKVQCRSTGAIYAAKIFRDRISEVYARNEISTLEQLTGENIVIVRQMVLLGTYTKKSGSQYSCSYILMEPLPNGDLFKFLSFLGSPRPEMVRFLFSEILKALETVHISGFAYGGLKLENFYIDSDFHIKLTDFSKASPLDSEPNISIQSKYTPPEAFLGPVSSGQAADIFSAGVILFLLQTSQFPFYSSKPLDLFYSQLTKNPRVFWDMQKKNYKSIQLSEDFKNLIESMLCFEPKTRANLDEIKAHEWIKGPMADYDEFKELVLKIKPWENDQKIKRNMMRNRFCNQSSGKNYEFQYNTSVQK